MNPASEGFNHYQNELAKAKQEIEKLKERIKAMNEGISMNLTQVVDNRVETNASQEVEGQYIIFQVEQSIIYNYLLPFRT